MMPTMAHGWCLGATPSRTPIWVGMGLIVRCDGYAPAGNLSQRSMSNIANPNGTIPVWFQARGGHHYVWENNISSAGNGYSARTWC